jgi:hypothetical protein
LHIGNRATMALEDGLSPGEFVVGHDLIGERAERVPSTAISRSVSMWSRWA